MYYGGITICLKYLRLLKTKARRKVEKKAEKNNYKRLSLSYRLSLKELEKEELEVVRDAIFDIERLDDLDKYLN